MVEESLSTEAAAQPVSDPYDEVDIRQEVLDETLRPRIRGLRPRTAPCQ